MAKRSFYARFAWPILIAHVMLIPIACVSAIRAVKSNRNDVSDWLPKDYDETRELALVPQALCRRPVRADQLGRRRRWARTPAARTTTRGSRSWSRS